VKTALIICNGAPVSKKVFKTVQRKYNTDIICADGGSSVAYKFKVIPKFVIGDLDSSERKVLNYFRKKGTKIIKLKRQSDTDLEKALKLCKSLNYQRLFIIGFSGKRFDHTISNISNSLKFANEFRILLIEKESTIYILSGLNEFSSFKGELVSIYSFSPNALITTSHLKYPLKKETLMFSERESTSNRSNSNKFSINVENGFAILVRSTKNFLVYD